MICNHVYTCTHILYTHKQTKISNTHWDPWTNAQRLHRIQSAEDTGSGNSVGGSGSSPARKQEERLTVGTGRIRERLNMREAECERGLNA